MPRIAVLGANAHGLYTLDLLMRCATTSLGAYDLRDLEVELIDPLPAPVGVAALHTTHPLATKVHLTGNVDLSADDLAEAFDSVIVADYPSDLAAQFAVTAALEKAASTNRQTPLPDFHDFLRSKGIHFTPWAGALYIPSDRTLAQWEAFVETAHGAPICF